MEEKTKRFFNVLNHLDVTGYKLSKQSPLITQQKLTNAKSGRNIISTDIVMELCRLYPHVNPSYILAGDGNMFKPDEVQSLKSTDITATKAQNNSEMEKEKAIKILNNLVNYLGITVNQLSESIGKSRSQWAYDVLNPQKKVGISKNIAEMISKRYPEINEAWLLGVDDKMLLTSSSATPTAESERNTSIKDNTDIVSAKLYLRENLVNIPYVPIDAKASFVESLYDTTYDMDFYGVMPEDGEDLISGDYVVFQIKGDSMSPNIPNSSKVLARKIPERRWETASGVVVIVYGKTLTIKRILKNSLFGGNSLTLKADNPEYGQFEVERKEIRGMWQAIRIVSKTII